MAAKRRTRAYVTGVAPLYTLVIPAHVPNHVYAQFGWLGGSTYTRFRAAQMLANTINRYAERAP